MRIPYEVHVKMWKLQHDVLLARAGSFVELWEVHSLVILKRMASLAHIQGVCPWWVWLSLGPCN